MKAPEGRIRFRVAHDAESAAQRGADLIVEELRCRPDLLMCAAAGTSPRRTYQWLGQAAQRHPSLFEHLRIIEVDEWLGLREGEPATCTADLRTHLLEPLRLPPGRFQGFRTDTPHPEGECERVAQWLTGQGPIDLCVLGVGANGHLAMNEPAEMLRPHAHVAELTPVSLEHPLLRSCPKKPSHGLTLGMADLLQSRKILLLACGPHKRPVLRRLLEPQITTQFPASLLWLHPDVTVLTDRAAAPDWPPSDGP